MTSACRRRAVERSRATEGERGGASYKRIKYVDKKLFTIYQHIFPHLENVSKRKHLFIVVGGSDYITITKKCKVVLSLHLAFFLILY